VNTVMIFEVILYTFIAGGNTTQTELDFNNYSPHLI
jgi:hypothetical protein